MYQQTIDHFVEIAERRAEFARRGTLSFFTSAMMGGAYIGMAVILALSFAAPLMAGVRPMVMGTVFGIGLILVVFGGAELFTGQLLYQTFAVVRGGVSWQRACFTLALCWLGNAAGAMVLAAIYAISLGSLIADKAPFLLEYVHHKTALPVLALLTRGILCNWLVCVAIWSSARLQEDTAKLIVIGWCLLAFVGLGFEHSVANMTSFCLWLFAAPIAMDDVLGMARNLFWVSLGNALGGSVIVGLGYVLVSRSPDHTAAIHECGGLPGYLTDARRVT